MPITDYKPHTPSPKHHNNRLFALMVAMMFILPIVFILMH